MKIRRRRLVVRLVLTLVLTLATMLPASLASAAPPIPLGRWSFAVSRPSYKKTDARTIFTAQVNTRVHSRTMAWSLRLTPALRALSTGTMDCVTTNTKVTNYRDTHPDIRTSYLLHSSVPGLKFNRNYTLKGKCVFPVKVGGRRGTATLEYAFNYSIFSLIVSSTARSADQRGTFSTSAAKPAARSKVTYKFR
jgi:hypothetical protein